MDPVRCPACVWGAIGSGRWRAHVDYLRSTREGETSQEVNVLAAWRFPAVNLIRPYPTQGPTESALPPSVLRGCCTGAPP